MVYPPHYMLCTTMYNHRHTRSLTVITKQLPQENSMTPSNSRDRGQSQRGMGQRKCLADQSGWKRRLEGHQDESHSVFSWENKPAEWGWKESRKGIKSLSTSLGSCLLHYMKPCLIQVCAVDRQKWDSARGAEEEQQEKDKVGWLSYMSWACVCQNKVRLYVTENSSHCVVKIKNLYILPYVVVWCYFNTFLINPWLFFRYSRFK